ncbi:hypothetical protein, partial [Aquisphaera insulae]|uniref:hypothetical protein n=1 Tax=Aquisphaera insulae TaxID=2712864 RepID=UPI0013EAF31C
NSPVVNLDGGTFTANAATYVSQGSLTFAGGEVVGAITIYNGGLALLPTAGAGSFITGGGTTLSGDIHADQSVWV